jgi:hypothetical protein
MSDINEKAEALREHERRAQEHDETERPPAGEDEAGTSTVSTPDPDAADAGGPEPEDVLPPPRHG